ncbi:MAG: FecR family protein [Planctomycetes bacterium]|nr:FecR family protein [Planctomycetota bacterium]
MSMERIDMEEEALRLLSAQTDGTLDEAGQQRLCQLLVQDAAARKICREYAALTAALRRQSRREQAEETEGWRLEAVGQEVAALTGNAVSGTALAAGDILARRASEGVSQGDSPIFGSQKLGQSPSATFRISALALAVAFVAIGILAYTFWPSTKQLPANLASAKIVNLTDAKWLRGSSQSGDTLNAGQQLLLQSGSVEITFNSQARVIVSGPAELTIVDAAACRLAAGRLTAQVPDPAKGFKVDTPSGTVTDLGTEFGVYVRSEAGGGRLEEVGEEEQQPGGGPQQGGKQTPITEVHVFKGRVEVARSEVGSGKSEAIAQNPTSDLRPPTILSAGQAVTISDNKVQPLPAADPFKFALDKLQGKPRQVLLSEDFESYDVGVKRDAMGAWMIQGSIRKGQAVGIGDYDKAQADWTAQHGLADPSLSPLPPSISRVLAFAPSDPNPRSEFPRVARPIEAPQLAHTCRVLMEFVIFPSGNIEPSFAFAAEAGIAPGIEFWRNADPVAPATAWKANLVYRVRVLMDVAEGKLRGARVERSQWSGSAGWVRDADFRTPVPQVDWTTPPKFVIFGYPTVTPQTPATPYNIDNIRIEVIAEK